MSFHVSLQQRIQQLKKLQADLPDFFQYASTEATKRAVQATTDATPPKPGSRYGTNTITGELKAAWAADSIIEPTKRGTQYVTALVNLKQYASYVNDGHRMDRHFVPGLYIDANGMLSMDLNADVGMMVGTKTKYVKGEFMTDKGHAEYEKALLEIHDAKIKELIG